ncbi:MAG TPA: hypothetical protein VG893_08515 [Terracidiphilus sp.]|nr:hypothetical protein [Terracidiphilus sp.]
MSKKLWNIFAGLCGVLLWSVCVVSAGAQAAPVKEKPPMYSYVANWQVPRAHWAEMEAASTGDNALLDKAMADGTIVAYGNDEVQVHEADGPTHDDWWSSMSMGGLMKVLDDLASSGSTTSSALMTATKHWDEVFVSRYYNWKPGSYKKDYTHVSMYKLKADAPDDALEMLSSDLIAPLLEKMLADGTIVEYEIDTMAIHTESPDTFAVVYVTPSPDGMDKVTAAIEETLKVNPLAGPAFGSMTDSSAHRDELLKGVSTFK